MKSLIRILLQIFVWLFWIGIGLVTMELYVRHIQGYKLWSIPLFKETVFSEADKTVIYNKKYYEENKILFENWPIPLDFFEAPTPYPRYLFKPNLKFKFENHRLIPAKEDERVYWSSNSWGFRGPEFSVQKPEGTIRIVCLGASTTEGVNQSDEETYPYLLGKELEKRFPNQKFEVINAGHHGLRSFDLLELMKMRVFPLNPDIIIHYEAHNDLSPAYFMKGIYKMVSRLQMTSALYHFVRDRFLWSSGIYFPHQFYVSRDNPSIVRYQKALREMAKEVKRQNMTLILSSFSTVASEDYRFEGKDYSKATHYHEQFYPLTFGEIQKAYGAMSDAAREVAREENVSFADVAPKLPKNSEHFGGIIHMTVKGHQKLAEAFADYLEKENLLNEK